MKVFEGKPIKPHVDKLMETLDLKVGGVYLHQDIANIAGVEYPSHRYRTVVAAFRRRLLTEANLDMEPVIGAGYRILDDNERVGVGVRDFARSARRMGRSADRVARADTAKLDEQHRRKQEHAMRLIAQTVDAARSSVKRIAIAGSIVSLPRAKLDGTNDEK